MENMTLQTVDRALTVLELIAEQPRSQQDIERALGLNRTTANRLINTLLQRKYLEKNPNTGLYQVGLKTVEIASVRLNHIELKTESAPLLRALSMALNQVCHMGILDEGEVVYIEKIEPIGFMRMFSAIGKRASVHSTSLGKVLVSALNDNEIRTLLQKIGMKRYTKHTMTDIDEYIEDIHQVRKRGYAFDNEENEEGIHCVAAPIIDYRNKIVAAISTSGSEKRSTEQEIELIRQVTQTAKQISQLLGATSSL